jgi:hypothetical protein
MHSVPRFRATTLAQVTKGTDSSKNPVEGLEGDAFESSRSLLAFGILPGNLHL